MIEKYNWYEISNNFERDAGIKEIIPTALLMAVIAVMSGSAIYNAAQKYNVQKEEIQSVLNDNKLTELIKSKIDNPQYQEDHSYQYEDSSSNNTQEEERVENKYGYSNEIKENIIARTIYAEGRGESIKGMMAIASVIYNRGNGNPGSMIEEIKKPYQFSCWNSATEKDWTNMRQGSGSPWEISMSIARSLMDGSFQPIGNWNHYYNNQKANPSWAYHKGSIRPHEQIGRHRFMHIRW